MPLFTIAEAAEPNFLWPSLLTVGHLLVALVASGHVLLTKRDTHAAIGWIGLIWFSPFLGTIAYVLLGVNRIARKARTLRRPDAPGSHRPDVPFGKAGKKAQERPPLGPEAKALEDLAELVGRITERPLTPDNAVRPLVGGDEGYPAMIEAIDGATRSVAMASYIFNNDRAGALFIEALKRAVGRGVEVRVLIDDVGSRYHLPTSVGPLRAAGVRTAKFMPTLTPGWFRFANLRNHRKILVVDGRVGFTGGLNVDESYYHKLQPRTPMRDTHFRLDGPVVRHLMGAFAEDWEFATDECLDGDLWFPKIGPAEGGEIAARGISDGPDEDSDKLLMTILGALSCAQETALLVTPYFIPGPALISAINVAALRGVQVDIVLPKANNHRTVQWASNALLGPVVQGGAHVWLSPPPFDHTKLIVVDRRWTLIGSGNLDPRSLRLNFEFNVECYSSELAGRLEDPIRRTIAGSEALTADWLENRSLPVKLRDGIARLLSPYL